MKPLARRLSLLGGIYSRLLTRFWELCSIRPKVVYTTLEGGWRYEVSYRMFVAGGNEWRIADVI